jgi:hypothetical protein
VLARQREHTAFAVGSFVGFDRAGAKRGRADDKDARAPARGARAVLLAMIFYGFARASCLWFRAQRADDKDARAPQRGARAFILTRLLNSRRSRRA